MGKGVVLSFALVLAVLPQAKAQDFVSATAGVLHYFEGAVSIDSKPIEHRAAVFPSLKNGSFLQTSKGRAELLLTPGVYLRMDEDTSVRMISNSLSAARVELMDGSVIVDNLNAASRDDVALIYSGTEVRFPAAGIYRLDRFTGELQVFSGEAKITRQGSSQSTSIDPKHLYYFALDLTMTQLMDGLTDEFYDWARNRSDLIADQVQVAAAEQQDSQDPDPSSVGGLLGLPPVVTPAAPSPLYSAGALSYGGINSYPNYPFTSPYFGFTPIFVLAPGRYRSGGLRWPYSGGITSIGVINRPAPIVTRWPRPATLSGFSGSGLLYTPVRSGYSLGTPMTRTPLPSLPRISTTPRISAPAAPRIAAPHLSVVGHR